MESQKKNKVQFRPNANLKLMDQVREVLRYYHYAYRTEQTYCQWILRYIRYFGGKTHPNLLGAKDIESFLSHLATVGKVSASTQKQSGGGQVYRWLLVGFFRISSRCFLAFLSCMAFSFTRSITLLTLQQLFIPKFTPTSR